MKKVGLTLGKFAPLHKGHQYMIETALKEVDELIVIIYDTSVINVPLPIRSEWIKKLYPSVKVIEAWDCPEPYSNIDKYEKQEEQYVLELLKEERVTHFYCSEYYGKHMSKALNAIDRRLDESKQLVPISATMIREDLYRYRNMLSSVVYRDLITKIVFVGAMSTGKSTITEELAKRYNTTFASEYGRDYWTLHQHNRRIGLEAFDEIGTRHIEIEDKNILDANQYFFVDTNAITTYMFAMDYHGKATQYLTQLALENAQRYDLFFLCDDDIPYDDTWDRSGEQKRHIFHKQIIADLERRKIPFIVLKGNLEERIQKVDNILKRFILYENFYGRNV